MKVITLILLIFVSPVALAINVNIGYPVEASRMSLYGHTTARIDCEKKTVNVIESTNAIFDRHVRKNKMSICYNDKSTYTVTFMWEKGSKSYRQNMIAAQTSRYFQEENKVVM